MGEEPIFEPLGRHHDRAAFSCSSHPELTNYLKKLASQHAKRRIASTTVMIVDTPLIAGYYTLSSGRLALGELPQALAKKYPVYTEGIPATLIGRLAMDDRYTGRGLGEALLMNALRQAYAATRVVASAFVIVRAIDAHAFSFYRKYDFQPYPSDPERLFLAMDTIRQLAEPAERS